MTEPNPQNEKPKGERRYDPKLIKKGLRCDQDQYEMLLRCSKEKNITEWNEWRKKNPDEDVFLEGADLSEKFLKGVLLNTANYEDRTRIDRHVFSVTVHLKHVNLRGAQLDKANFSRAHLEEACLQDSYVRKANLRAYLVGADLWRAHLEGTDLWRAHLEGADFYEAHLQNTRFRAAQVDGRTLLASCEVDNRTDFTGVALDNACVEPRLKQLIEYNIRRLGWGKWYDNLENCLDWHYNDTEHKRKPPKWKRFLKKALVRTFWRMSDYGKSTGRIAAWFMGFALVFAGIYYLSALVSPPGIISNLFEVKEETVPCWIVPFRTIYFSFVTMTTLGFGDMYANAQSIWGHILLTMQVILGYVLLGALVTRFAVLFTAGGPAGTFANDKGQKTDDRKQKTDDGGRLS